MNLAQTRRLTWLLFFGQSLSSASFIAGSTIGAIVGAGLSGQPALAGVPAAAFGLGAALGAYPAARLMERVGRRKGLMLGYAIGVVGALLAGLAIMGGNFLAFLIGFGGMGIARGFSDLGRYAAAEMNPAAERGRAISLVVFGGTIGAIAGPALVAPMGDLAIWLKSPALAGPWFAAAALHALGLLLIGVFLRPDPSELARRYRETAGAPTGKPVIRPLRVILAQPATRLALLSMVVGQLVMVMLMSITALHMTNHGHGLGDVAIITMAHTLGMYGLSMVTGRLADNFGRVPTIIAGAGLLILACALAPLSLATGLLALSMFLLGLGWNFGYVAGAALLTDSLTLAERGRVQGGSDLAVGLVSAFGSVQSGLLFAWTGFPNLSLISLIIVLPSLLLAVRHLARRVARPGLVSTD
jgi:MFS family permease